MADWLIIPPSSSEHWLAYYQLRFDVLRQPWGQEKGSELADDDAIALHGMIADNNGDALAVGRIHMTAEDQAQVRFMAVKSTMHGFGLGKRLLHYLEHRAKKEHPALVQILLHAREHAVPFYEKQGYQVIDKSYVLFDSIQHYLMVKSLI